MTLHNALLQSAALTLVGALLANAIPAPASAKAPDAPINRGMESVNQPVVQRTDYVFDAVPDGFSALSVAEKQRLRDWFDAIQLGYGDRVAIVADGLAPRATITNAIGDMVGSYGLLLADRAPVTAGIAPSGSVRIVVSRSTASVPNCPDWSGRAEGDVTGGLSNGYGCAINGNLAAMIANPEDLVQGRNTNTPLREQIGARAVRAYRGAAPSGGGGTALK